MQTIDSEREGVASEIDLLRLELINYLMSFRGLTLATVVLRSLELRAALLSLSLSLTTVSLTLVVSHSRSLVLSLTHTRSLPLPSRFRSPCLFFSRSLALSLTVSLIFSLSLAASLTVLMSVSSPFLTLIVSLSLVGLPLQLSGF